MILAFVVLLTVLVLAYFSYSSLQRQISTSSSSQATVDIFAQGAINTIVTDFKQEIAAGSTNSTFGTNTVSLPLAASNAAPVRVATSTNLPNLVKRSASGQAFFPGGPSRASAVSSTAASQNGRSISTARWNQALLLPKANTNSPTDLSPVAAFAAPDWIYVNRGGGNPTAWNTSLRWNPSTTDTNVVVGRYAYAIYDEGGLLDVNVAGFPPGATDTLSGYKNPLAYADLTQVGLTTNSISALVGWRNAVSAQPAGTFPNYTFSASSQTNYFRSVSTNSTGFLRTANTNVVSGETDRMFISRQHFLQFLNSLADAGLQDKATLQNSAQYLGTFSRALEQPSFAPHPGRPRIIGSSAPPVATSVDSYQGNNDGYGGDDVINPSFLSVRVAAPFTRLDGTSAAVNDPLVHRRFPLMRLGYLTFEGPSNDASSATKTILQEAGVPQQTISEGTAARILDCFGLTWNSSRRSWVYNHGSNSIRTLAQVAAANRDPDFAELLKAAITVGSLAKGGPNLHNNQGNAQYTLDTSVDYNVLQIMANLIDQFDGDSYPTQIEIAAGSVTRTLRGAEDLPYFYRYHPMTVVTRLPVPLLSKTQKVDWRRSGEDASVAPFKSTSACAPGTLSDAGEAVYLYVPDVWNPHDASGVAANPTGARPSRFRLAVVTQDPSAQTPIWNTGVISKVDGDWYDDIPPKASIPTNLQPLGTEAATAFTFSDNNGRLFREPTLLWRTDVPNGAGIAVDAGDAGSKAGPHVDVNTGVSYYGVQIGKTPVSYQAVPNPAQYWGTPTNGPGSYIFQGGFLEPNQRLPVGAYAQYTFRLQYRDPSGNWITYDEKYPDFHGLYRPTLIVNKDDFPNNRWKNPYSSNQMNDCSTGYDPRTGRFGIGTATTLDLAGSPMLEPGAAGNHNSGNSAGNDAFAAARPSIMVTQRPLADRGNRVNYSNPGMTSDPGRNAQMRFFTGVGFSASNGDNTKVNQFDGMWSQNNPAVLTQANNGANRPFFYEDPDGIGRRAMGAYALTGVLPASQSAAASSNLDGLPMVTANTYSLGSMGVGTPTAQNQSRPFILNRPFRSVGEMSATFRGGLWKQIDFFTPESGDAALLDVFCINEPPVGGTVAGKVNLNTRQTPVLKAVLAGAYRDQVAQSGVTPPSGSITTPLSATEADNVAKKLVEITGDSVNAWRGPLRNVSEIVGRYVPGVTSTGGATDSYVFTEPVTSQTYVFAGLSGALDATVYANARTAAVQRLRESAIRPLAAVGQVRVWNVMLDLVVQTGRFPASATSLDRFSVEGEKRYWVHLAIDRFTGKVIDRQLELVTE